MADREYNAASDAEKPASIQRALRAVAHGANPVGSGEASRRKLLAEIYRSGNVLSQRNDDGQIVLRARVDEQLASRLTRSGASVAYPR